MRRAAGLDEARLEMQADVAEALADRGLQTVESLFGSVIAEAGVGAAIAGHDHETARSSRDSSLAGPAWMPNAPIKLAVSDVVHAVAASLGSAPSRCSRRTCSRSPSFRKPACPQSSDPRPNETSLSPRSLRRVDREVAARVDRGAKHVERNVAADVGLRRAAAGRQRPSRRAAPMNVQTRPRHDASEAGVKPGQDPTSLPSSGSPRSNKRQYQHEVFTCALPRRYAARSPRYFPRAASASSEPLRGSVISAGRSRS